MKILSRKAVIEYQAICKKEGREISYEEAQREGLKLLRFVQLLYRPIPKSSKNNEEMNKYAKNR